MSGVRVVWFAVGTLDAAMVEPVTRTSTMTERRPDRLMNSLTRDLKRALEARQSDERERQTLADGAAQDAKIARLREARLAKEAAERSR